MMENTGVDFVIIWVDGSDRQWLEEKNRYSPDDRKFNVNDVRYRDWNILRYWFRCVEAYAPWVRKIHFVTCGQVPEWLNLEHPKLHFVQHKDYIPQEYLPTFSSHPIELNIHRIAGLSEKFVYFNDDMFFAAPVTPEDFFHNDLPKCCAVLNPPTANIHGIGTIIMNNLGVIAEHFDFKTQFAASWKKWLTPVYGTKLLRTFLLLPWRRYLGFLDLHLPLPLLKSTMEEVWHVEEALLNKASSHRFRNDSDVNQWLMSYWQIAKGEFYPMSPKVGRLFDVSRDMDSIVSTIENKSMKMICINDSEKIQDFEALQARLIGAFEQALPQKSSFEK